MGFLSGIPSIAGLLREGSPGESRIPRSPLHRRRRPRRVLAAASAVRALGVLRIAGPCAHLRAVAGKARLGAVLPATPQEPPTDRTQRRRKALGAQEPQPPVL